MANQLRVGLCLPFIREGQTLGFADVRELALQADNAGADSVWYADHFYLERPRGNKVGVLECWTVLTALAAITKNVRLGSLVLCQSFRHPSLLAKMAATLQDVSEGRLVLGIGSGWFQAEYDAFGFPFDHRVSRFEEYLTGLTALLDNQTVNMHGRYFTLDDAKLLPPSRPVPTWVASSGPRMNHLTAKFGAGWNGAWYGGNVTPFKERLDRLRAIVRETGRDPDELEYSAGIFVIPISDPGHAARLMDAIRQANPLFAQLSDEQIQHRIIVGTPDQVADKLEEFRAAGADTAIVSVADTPFGLWSRGSWDLACQHLLPNRA